MQILNPAVNSIAYAFALRHRISAILEKRNVPDTLQPGGTLWNQLVLFLETADPIQLRYVGKEWRYLVEQTEAIARACDSVGRTKCYFLHEMLTTTGEPGYCAHAVGYDST